MGPKQVIWKYKIEADAGSLGNVATIELPAGSRPLSVQRQSKGLVLWAVVFPSEERVKRRVWILGTGEDLPERFDHSWEHLGTVQIAEISLRPTGGVSWLVCHCFLEPLS